QVVGAGDDVGRRVHDGVADALDVVAIAVGIAAVTAFHRRLDSGAEGLPCVIGVGEVARRRLADVPYAEREDEAVERHAAPRLDGLEQVFEGLAAVTLLVDELVGALLLSPRQFENVRRLSDPAFIIESLDLLLAQSLDVERVTRDEVAEP